MAEQQPELRVSKISEEEIDQLTMPKAMKKCREYKISLGDNKELDKIKWLIKFHLLCQTKRQAVRA
jgi:hypothetical protein